MSNNKLRRRCFKCKKRVNLKVLYENGIKVIKCPNCLSACNYISQKKYEERKKRIFKLCYAV
jgi:Zn ribbon nucleic-acid-binding protein